uniref:EGF-like domain-containing protein n=1 Tax=Ditylenchus dipsaci TaxID=166011 RepID=A0A915CSI0_9BILA
MIHYFDGFCRWIVENAGFGLNFEPFLGGGLEFGQDHYSEFSFLSQSVDSVGTIDVNIRQLVLRKTPPECCRSEVECMLLGLPSQPNRTSYDHCQLTFRLCISVPETRASECLILSRQFSLDVHMSKPLNWEDRTFSAVQLPSKSFNVTSVAIDSPVERLITLEVWNPGNDKLLLYSRNFVHISPGETTPKTLSTTSSQNSLITSSQPAAMPDIRAWYVIQGGQDLASCAGPDECRCSKGWRGKQCEECIPKQGCRNGYCLSEPGKCICKPNWTGADCELRIDKCLDKPCQNGGKCTTNGLHGEAFHCSCREGFTGEDCSKLVSPCANSPCGLHARLHTHWCPLHRHLLSLPSRLLGALTVLMTDAYPNLCHILTTPTTPNRTNQSIETSTIPKATSQPPKPVPEEKVETAKSGCQHFGGSLCLTTFAHTHCIVRTHVHYQIKIDVDLIACPKARRRPEEESDPKLYSLSQKFQRLRDRPRKG